jgi:hypothetical protein
LTRRELLRRLARDPGELHDLAAEPGAEAALREWRQRLTAHLAPRGDHWVKGGRLVPRADDPAYSPNFPA